MIKFKNGWTLEEDNWIDRHKYKLIVFNTIYLCVNSSDDKLHESLFNDISMYWLKFNAISDQSIHSIYYKSIHYFLGLQSKNGISFLFAVILMENNVIIVLMIRFHTIYQIIYHINKSIICEKLLQYFHFKIKMKFLQIMLIYL